MNNEAALLFLSQCIRSTTQGQFNLYCNTTDFTIIDLPEEELKKPHGEEMSIILIWGSIVQINLKMHFSLEMARSLAAEKMGQKPENIADRAARDYMTEFSNLQAGHFRALFKDYGISLGMSLPFSAMGEDEFIFRKIRDPRACPKTWRISNGKYELFCTTEITLLDASSFEQVMSQCGSDVARLEEHIAADSGDVEFI